MSDRSYWIGVVSKEHVDMGVAGGYMQVNHGKAGPLERMRAGDGFAFYSPRTSYPDGEPLQAFTAIGRIRSGTVYQATAGESFRPFRLDVDYFSAQPAPVRPLIESLAFIRSKAHWGAAFRFGVLRVPETDFALIAAAMGRAFADDFGSTFADARTST
jgi:EVE domain